MKMNTVFYLALIALMFGLGTCAVVNMEPKINEDEIDAAGTILREIFKVHQDDGTFENSVSDTESQNNNLTCAKMRCSWKSNSGTCTLYTPYATQLQFGMLLLGSGMAVALSYKHRAFIHHVMRDGMVTYFNFRILNKSYRLEVRERRITCPHAIVCLKLTVSYGCRRLIYNFGCTRNIYQDTESKPVKGVVNWNSNLKNCMESEDVDSVKTENVKNFIESNQNENSLKWDHDA
ncbi:uncharacterized protein LOC115218374 [Octopus sinensis]|uniref:Uncharacterized protein LOC115218374 n=1 Tax=Octopus sinensis TaxID=2607531 RepID=A0A6P7T009_9MOLL|nr:uncharacterized protein LOC115218374 [Octopus sinensis]